jgi:hypothetical protein
MLKQTKGSEPSLTYWIPVEILYLPLDVSHKRPARFNALKSKKLGSEEKLKGLLQRNRKTTPK